MPQTIFPYLWQQPSVDRLTEILSAKQFAINSSATGTGKTVVSLQLTKNLGCPALIICPLAVHTAWLRTAAAMDCSNQILGVVNPQKLLFNNPYISGLNWLIPKGTIIVWDEVHKGASGPKSKTTKILAATRPQGIKVLAMSATIASSPLQMRAIGYLAGLHQFNPSSYWKWCLDNGCYRAAYANGQLVFPKGPRAQALMSGISDKLKDIMVRVRIADVPEFPETQVIANLYDLEANFKAEIDKAYEDMRDDLKKLSSNPLIIRLRARERTELSKVCLLVSLVEDAIEDGKSVVVFVNFRSTLAELEAKLSPTHKLGLIYGDQKDTERQDAIDMFQADKIEAILCMTQAGGVGISLHGLPGKRERCSFITPSDSASDFVQCLGRIHRSGGSKSVQTIVLAAGTVEEKIQANLQGKLQNLQSLIDGINEEDMKL